ncbi:MAG: DNRLRE domain-containing protein [Acidimicrobiales bacterium]
MAQAKPGEELVDRRTANSRTFVGDEPGQLRTELYDAPVHFKDAQGRWADIDESLVAGTDGRRHAAANAFDLSVAASSTDAALARLSVDDKHSVGFSLDGAAKVTAKADAKTATYPKVRRDTDVRLTSRANGVKEELVLASRLAPYRFVFPLELKGLTASINEAGDVIYRDETGAERARTPHGFMTDSNVDTRSGEAPMSLDVVYALIPWGKDGTALEVRLDPAWLDDPARVYPVIVDPEIHNASWGDDTYVMQNFSRDNSYDAELKVGTYDGGGRDGHIGRSYMHFDTAALAGASVQHAELHLAERHSWNCGYWPEPAYRVTQGWDGRTMRDFPGAEVAPNGVGGTWEGTTCGARTAKWDVTGMAGHWASVSEQQGSISLRATNESDNNMYKRYGSTEGGAPPALHVWYTPPNRPPAVPSGVTPAHGTTLGTSTTSVSAIYSDPDGGFGQLAFGVWNNQNQLQWSQWSGTLCAGCRATLNVPALPDNWYYVRVIGHDGAQYSSAWSWPQWFFIDTLPPAASQVTPANGANGATPSQVTARYSEPYGFSGYVYFWLYTTGGSKIIENWSAVTASGSVATLSIPGLGAGTYNLWAMPWDTRQLGTQVGPNTFTVVSSTTTTTLATTSTTVVTTSTTSTVVSTTTTVAPTTTTTTTMPSTTTTTVPPLDPPTMVTAKKAVGSATVTWEPPTQPVTRYEIEFSGSEECSGCGGTTPPAGARSTIVTGLTDNIGIYAFVVVAFNDDRNQLARSQVSNPIIPGPPDYIALGDSYSSGEGTDDEEVPCNRSPHSFAPVYANELAPEPQPDLHFFACTGATTSDLLSQQVGLISPYEADLVTVTIGGNDAGFAEVLRHCALVVPLPTHCDQEYPNKQQEIEDLFDRLVEVYQTILDVTSVPQVLVPAQVVVLTYPQIFAAGGAPTDCPIYRDVDENERMWIRARTADMDRVISAAVAHVGSSRLTVLSELNRFDGHDMCADEPFVNAGVVTEPDDSMHPTAAGYRRMAEDLAAHLASLTGGGLE